MRNGTTFEQNTAKIGKAKPAATATAGVIAPPAPPESWVPPPAKADPAPAALHQRIAALEAQLAESDELIDSRAAPALRAAPCRSRRPLRASWWSWPAS
jgi:hypothetical protein